MYIVQIGSEVAPYAKVGGLGDVVLGLSRKLHQEGHDVDVIIPKYDCLKGIEKMTLYKDGVQSLFQDAWHDNSIYHAPLNEEMSLTLLEAHHARRFFERGAIYGFPDDVDRFLYFSRACLDFLANEKKIPDIIHIHDWMCAPIAFLIRQEPFLKKFAKTRVVLSIHNMEYQGWAYPHLMQAVGYTGPLEPLKMPFSQDVNCLKGGIVFADAVTTVSPTYAKEVMTEEGGKGLQEVMKAHSAKFSGILNGIDSTYWNPENDRYLKYHFSSQHFAGKTKNKHFLQEQLGLERQDHHPLLATICRLVPQKGVHLIKEAVLRANDWGVQCVILGSTHEPKIQEEFTKLAEKFATDKNIRIILKNDERLAHEIYAAADLFLVPSIFEPCGLTQMIAMSYGAVPIVRKTGGLADTVFDGVNGFSFIPPEVRELEATVRRAVGLYKKDKNAWHQLMQAGMLADWSWKESCGDFLALYKKILLSS